MTDYEGERMGDKKVPRKKLLLCVLLAIVPIGLLLALFLWSLRPAGDQIQDEQTEGRARKDIAAGRFLVYEMISPVDSVSDRYVSLLWDRYHVRAVPSGDVITPEMEQERTYSSVTESFLRQKYGRDIFKECEQETSRQIKRPDGKKPKGKPRKQKLRLMAAGISERGEG